MTAIELQKRNEKAQSLRVIQVNEITYYVESSEGKICYRVIFSDDEESCTCGDYAQNSKNKTDFKCKHILSVLNSIPLKQVENGKVLEKRRTKLDERFIANIKGKEFVLYAGLLDLAHQKGLNKIKVEVVQYPKKENGLEAIAKATVISKVGEEYEEWGDANPRNVNKVIAEHVLRMCCTRAKARALRDFTNIGLTCLEELGNLDDIITNGNNGNELSNVKAKKSIKNTEGKETITNEKSNESNENQAIKIVENEKDTFKKVQETENKKEEPIPQQNQANQAIKSKTTEIKPKMSEAQKKAIYNLSKRRGITIEELESMSKNMFSCSLENLYSSDASSLIRSLQTAT